MNKEHLDRLQGKVNRLMRKSSQDSDNEQVSDFEPIDLHLIHQRQSEPETVRKCIDLIKENKQLKLLLEKQKKKTERALRELSRERKERRQKDTEVKNQNKKSQIDHDSARKLGKLEAQLIEQRKKSQAFGNLIAGQRKKCKALSQFINQNIPEIERNLDKLTASVDAKLQNFFLEHPSM